MTTAWRLRAAWALLPALAGCGGGGGGSGPVGTPPVIVAAAWLGTGPAPADGEQLLLFFSRDVELVAGALLGDADVTLSAGASLGAVNVAPSLLTSRSVLLTLGAGVSFVPDTTTIALAAGNDAVRDTSGRLGTGGTPVLIATSDGQSPTLSLLTCSGVDGLLNGTGAAGGTLQTPQHSFTIDLAWSDNTAVDAARTQLTASVAVSTASGSQPAGTNLLPFLTAGTVDAAGASYTVPTSTVFPAGSVTLTAIAVDITGLASTPRSFGFRVRNFDDNVRPFRTSAHPTQVWYLDFSRDVEAFTVNLGNTTTPVQVVATANGTSDFEDILEVLGLVSSSPVVAGSRATVLDRFRTALASNLAAFYSGTKVTFTYTRPAGSFPNGQSSVAYNSLGYSQMCIAGAYESTGQSITLGVAIYDPNNLTQNDNCRTDHGGQRLGVFLHTIVNDGFKQASTGLFRTTFDPFTPSRSGVPIGNDAQDGLRLAGSLPGTRQDQIDAAIAGFARYTAVVVAHECGHSMGLVKNGPQPTGLFGNSASFSGSSDGHIRIGPPTFPAGSTNVMSPSLNYPLTVHSGTAFNTLNLAYLRERVLYDN